MGRSYDCLLFANVLHLTANPAALLADLGSFLEPDGYCVVLVPNLGKAKNVLGKLRGDRVFQPIGNYEDSGTHDIRAAALRRWLAAAGLQMTKRIYLLSNSKQKLSRPLLGIADSLLAEEILVVGRKTTNSLPAS